VTNINKEDLFYFASRGVDEEEAKKNIVEGFLVY
jgi:Fe-S cluster assembly scaffold protein SufB